MVKLNKTLALAGLAAAFAAFLTLTPIEQPAPLQAQSSLTQADALDAVAFAMGEQEIEDIIKEYGDKVGKGTYKERVEAVTKLVATNSTKAYSKLERAFKPGDRKNTTEDDKVMYAIAEGIGNFTQEECIKKAAKEASRLKGSKDIFYAYLILKGLASTDSAQTRVALQSALDTQDWLMAAGLQAIVETGKAYWAPILLGYVKSFRVLPTAEELKKDPKAKPTLDQKVTRHFFDKFPLLGLTIFEAIGKTYHHEEVAVPTKDGKPDEASDGFKKHAANEAMTLDYLDELAIMISLIDADYMRYFVARAFQEIATFDGVPTDNDKWIEYYLSQRRLGLLEPSGLPRIASGETGPGRTRTKGPDFVGMPPVGKRIVICLDISSSMLDEVSDEIIKQRKEREEERKPITGEGGANKGKEAEEAEKKKKHRERIDWSKIETKFDLAKADFELTINDMDDSYYFNVVVYSKDSHLLDPKQTGFVKATKANKARFLKMVKDTETVTLTNIHGAILDAYSIVIGGGLKPTDDPATNEDALRNGANTIFFLTDGWGSWSDDSVEKVPDERITRDREPRVGDGKYIYFDDILTDFERLNKFRKIIVNCVGIGNHDRDLMAGMAEISGGEYVDLSGKNRPPPKRNR